MSKKKTKKPDVKRLTETEKEFNDLFENAILQRESSCFWEAGTGGESGSSGGDWMTRWDLQEQLAIMWFGQIDQSEGYRANVKSPEIAGRIQSTMQKLVKLNLEFEVRPKRPEAKAFAEVAQIMINDVFKKNKFKFRLNDAYYDAIRHGTSFVSVDFMVRKRKVKMPVTKEEHMTDEEKKAVKEKSEIPYREVTILDQRDVVIANRRIQELYFDPTARNIHEDLYYAGYYFDTMMMPKKRFLKLYKDKPGYKNIDKVKSVSEMADNSDDNETWFKPPKDVTGDYVYVVKGWDYDNDKFIVRANDQFIYESPLPYKHKKLNITALTPFKLPEQFYGIGLIDFLIPIVTQIEMLQNAIYDYTMYTTNPILMVEKNVYNDFSRHYRKAKPGLMIPVMDVNRAVAPLKYMPLSMDVFQALSSLQRDAVIASQVDPSQLGVVQKNATATANMINREVMDAYVNFIMTNFTEGLNEIASQVFALQHQYLTDKDVYEVMNGGEVDKVDEYRMVAVEDKQIDIDWDNKEVNIQDVPGSTGYLEIRPELFFYTKDDKEVCIRPEDFDIELTAESKEIISEALEAQRMKENLAQLSGFMVDPSDKQKTAQHPMPLVDATSFMEEYFEKNKINKRHLVRKDEEIKKSTERAMEQNQEMFNGIAAVPEAGEIDEHLQVHEELLKNLQAVKAQTEEKIKMQQEQFMAQADPNMVAMGLVQAPMDPQAMALLQRLQRTIQLLTEHITLDSEPAYMRTALTVQNAQVAAPMPGAGGQGGQTMMGGMGNMGGAAPANPQMAGINQNMPQQGGMTQGGPGMVGGLMGQ